jgi:hypothetical protein
MFSLKKGVFTGPKGHEWRNQSFYDRVQMLQDLDMSLPFVRSI